MRIPCRYLMTVEMGKESEIGQQMLKANVDVSAEKHCYLCVFTMVDRLNQSSYFQPYYSAYLPPRRPLAAYTARVIVVIVLLVPY